MVFLLTSIIVNFLRGEEKGIGNFVNSYFKQNGWHVIDATSLMDAFSKFSLYLGNNQADNIYINSHGLISQRYVFNENGDLIPDSGSDTGYKMTGDGGFHKGDEKF
ncbi:Uncharacterised protein [Chryseobacterium nakagawai]|uniref:Uncharacterized protein n=1 Tax=Chryseobacterium nakagawai TaxID=1241982 RepID=A0AAD0YDW2_CHRNA|nr:hypothetical protein [Chryseobacterium nakagawai]AZA89441.1 hypothetical protein EG343_01755 [Chryseobacterium nakagawai]VEH20801.1 Uncharacterised protein [Chryseobacterium nakagawai]